MDISFGANYTQRGLGYTHALVVRFDSKAAEAEYQIHPEHVRVRDHVIKPNLRTCFLCMSC